MKRILAIAGVVTCAGLALRGQTQPAAPIAIHVDAAARRGVLRPTWAYFGYDEPNYTDTANGAKLVGELAAAFPVPVHVRTHHLLVTGDGKPALKWGSTNVYTEDASGRPVYDFTILDRIFDTYTSRGAKPFVELGFMPEALSANPRPYARHWRQPDDAFGWAYPPADFRKWAALVEALVSHCVARYGRAEAASWYWELWNEPDLSDYWKGTPGQFNELYDHTAAAVKRVLPEARVGGPATTGPNNQARGGRYLEQFLEHCASGRNAVTGRAGAPLDFVTFHAKGSPDRDQAQFVRMGLAAQLRDVEAGLAILSKYPRFKGLPIVLSESDPEGCAACSSREYPKNAYRNGPLYPAYLAAANHAILALGARYQANIEGILTWAFLFEGQPYFDGFRTLATNGIDKPVLNYFRMVGLMRGDRVAVTSTGAVALDSILKSGVRAGADVDGMASRSDREVAVLTWNYHDEDVAAPDASVRLEVTGLPPDAKRLMVRHYRIDREHSNAFTAWQRLGSPQQPSAEQYRALEAAGQLELLESPRWVTAASGRVELSFTLPRQGLSLVQIGW
jgi:xylan 1,4-beta-xylosidase